MYISVVVLVRIFLKIPISSILPHPIKTHLGRPLSKKVSLHHIALIAPIEPHLWHPPSKNRIPKISPWTYSTSPSKDHLPTTTLWTHRIPPWTSLLLIEPHLGHPRSKDRWFRCSDWEPWRWLRRRGKQTLRNNETRKPLRRSNVEDPLGRLKTRGR